MGNIYGSDLSNSEPNDLRLLDSDYSIGGGVTMHRSDIDHGFKADLGHAGKGPMNWKLTNEAIRDRICESLSDHPSIDATDIHINVKEGNVFISGWVDDRYIKKDVERVIEIIPGVKDVFNELHLRSRKLIRGGQ